MDYTNELTCTPETGNDNVNYKQCPTESIPEKSPRC